jgi:hypothetical protein
MTVYPYLPPSAPDPMPLYPHIFSKMRSPAPVTCNPYVAGTGTGRSYFNIYGCNRPEANNELSSSLLWDKPHQKGKCSDIQKLLHVNIICISCDTFLLEQYNLKRFNG